MQSPAIEIDRLGFAWRQGTDVLDIAELTVQRGERLFVQGRSGSGKSTLLSLMGGIVVPNRGQIRLLGQSMQELGAAARDRFRADHLGVIFQLFNLLPYLSVLENVLLPCHFSSVRRQRVLARAPSLEDEAVRLLQRLQLTQPELWGRQVSQLSIGQQQRVAAARALMGGPEIIIADEPTSALDAHSRDAFVDLLLQECAGQGTTLLFVSHDAALAPRFDRTLVLETVHPREAL
ncbi:methionine ABC transporter ATP-binding protein [Marinobacterium aestuarii]|uniref:Methionine ABC transporter ATP-binding protein n=1 Tax=Marinobacterium aestuarii TaxID=1821621 RepID=A0A1A9F1F1_9GAMM|nr:ABC transporter ATP-binding protein [Marinobacterium aestuarii]ANG63698.1 methionine ABC transporter ATP-binding protein [Marinobacterium aestuarii]